MVHIFLDINTYFLNKRERESETKVKKRERKSESERVSCKTNLAWPAIFIRKRHINHGNLPWIYLKLVVNSRVAGDNIFFFLFSIWTNLINNNVIHNHIFNYYNDNYKCNIYIYIYNFYHTKIKTIHFFSRIQKIS